MYKKILVLLFFCTINNYTFVASLSFDQLFPLTWYEKGLHSTIDAWDIIQYHSPKENICQNYELDILIGKCAFAYFCLENMHKNRQIIIDEDVSYFASLLKALEKQVAEYDMGADDASDHVACLRYFIDIMKRALHVPTNINTK